MAQIMPTIKITLREYSECLLLLQSKVIVVSKGKLLKEAVISAHPYMFLKGFTKDIQWTLRPTIGRLVGQTVRPTAFYTKCIMIKKNTFTFVRSS